MAKRMQTIILFLAVMLFALSAKGQNGGFGITNFAPCNLLWSTDNGATFSENFLVEQLTWIEQPPNKIVIRDDERTIVLRDNQIDTLFNERTGFALGSPITVPDVISYLEVAKTGCMNRIVGDTIFFGLDTLVVIASGGALINSINGLNDDGTTVKLGGVLTENTLISGGGANFFAVQNLSAGELSSNGQTIVTGGTSLDLRSDVEININSTAGNDAEIKLTDAIFAQTSGTALADGVGTIIADAAEITGQPTGTSRFTSALLVGDIFAFTRGSAIFVSDTLTGQQARNFVVDGTPFRPYETMFAGQAVENINGNIAQNSFEFTVFGGDTVANSFVESLTFDDMQATAQLVATNEGGAGNTNTITAAKSNAGDATSVVNAVANGALGGDPLVRLAVDDTPLTPNEYKEFTLLNTNIFVGNDAAGTYYTLPYARGTNGQILKIDGGGNVTWQDESAPAQIWELSGDQYQIIELQDTSVQIEDSLLILNGANIADNKGNEIAIRQKFGYLMSTYDGFNSDLSWSPDTDPTNVWVNTNPLNKTYKWSSFYGLREQNFVLPGGTGAEQSYSAVLNSDGNIWNIGFDWGGGYIINPNSNDIERTTEGMGIAGQAMVNPRDGLTYITAISFNSLVQNPQLRKVALPGFPAFDVSVGFTRFNTGMGGAIASINNTLYSPPYTESQTTQVAKYDLTNNTGAFLPGNIATTGAGDFAYTSCAEGVDGNIYCVPYNNDYLLEIDPLTDTWIQWGNGNANDTVFATRGGWALINHPNGKMYVPPFVGARTLEIDPIAKTITEIGTTYPSGGANDMKWASAALHPNGKIYCFPYTDQVGNLLVIDPATGTTSTIPLSTTHAYWSTKIALNGSLWGLPAFGNQTVTRLDLEEPSRIYPIELVTSPQFSSR